MSDLIERVYSASRFPTNTCPASRHAVQIGEALVRGEPYPMLTEEPDHCGESILATVAALWEARTEIERLTAALKWEQSRADRQGTHGPGCADWGPAHYECAIRERDELRRQLAEAGESIAAQARTIADLRGALIESREMIRVDRDSLYETSANPDGTIDCEDDRKALAEYDDHLDYIAQVLGECVPAAMDITRPAEE